MKRINGIILGAVVTAAGVIFLLNSVGLTNINIFFDGWWTLFLIIPCAVGLFTDTDKIGNLIGLLIGIFLFLSCLGVISFSAFWTLMLPTIVIVIGIKILIDNIFNSKGSKVKRALISDGAQIKSGSAAFSGQDMNFDGEKFDGADLNAVFGAVKCDLRGAVIENDCVIDATAVFGGITIIVPSNIKVKVKSSSIFGGVSDKTAKMSDEFEHTLYINANCVFGGLDIK